MGVIIELTGSRPSWLSIFGGGLGNLCCLIITWLAIGFHTGAWVPGEFAPLLALGALISGSIGVLIAQKIATAVQPGQTK